MTFRALVLVSCPLCVWPLLYFFQRYYFYCDLQTIRIERELIKHTFLQRFLHYVNIICINITKRDPNNLIIFFFSPWVCASRTICFSVQRMAYVKSQGIHRSRVFISGFIPLLEMPFRRAQGALRLQRGRWSQSVVYVLHGLAEPGGPGITRIYLAT